VRQARSDTGKVSVSLTRPSFSRLNSSSMVISLDIEAGEHRRHAVLLPQHLTGSRVHQQRMLGAGVDHRLRGYGECSEEGQD